MNAPRKIVSGFFYVSAAFCAVHAAAFAQTLPDPTRPPAEISAPVAGLAAPPKDSGLQSVIISPTRRAAIINGQTVELGALLGDARLVEISESVAILERAQGRQVLALFPGVNISRKQPAGGIDMQHVTQKRKLVKKTASQIGKKGEK